MVTETGNFYANYNISPMIISVIYVQSSECIHFSCLEDQGATLKLFKTNISIMSAQGRIQGIGINLFISADQNTQNIASNKRVMPPPPKSDVSQVLYNDVKQ